jgi:drug/metabolite transporter (DMT)-like permease
VMMARVQARADVWAIAACLLAAMSYAVAGVWGRRFRRMGVAPLATAFGQVTASGLILTPLWLGVDQPWTMDRPNAASLGAIAGIAVLSTALAYVLYFRLLASAGATNLLLVTFLIPVSATLLGVLVLGEQLRPEHLAGFGLIVCGLAAIDGRLWRWVKPGIP